MFNKLFFSCGLYNVGDFRFYYSAGVHVGKTFPVFNLHYAGECTERENGGKKGKSKQMKLRKEIERESE